MDNDSLVSHLCSLYCMDKKSFQCLGILSSIILVLVVLTFPSCYRLSRWNHTKIFSEFDDGESENSDAEYMDTKTTAGRRSKATLVSDSKASLLR